MTGAVSAGLLECTHQYETDQHLGSLLSCTSGLFYPTLRQIGVEWNSANAVLASEPIERKTIKQGIFPL